MNTWIYIYKYNRTVLNPRREASTWSGKWVCKVQGKRRQSADIKSDVCSSTLNRFSDVCRLAPLTLHSGVACSRWYYAIYLSPRIVIDLSIYQYRSIDQSIDRSISIYLHLYMCKCLYLYLSIYLSIRICICISIYLSIKINK